MDPFSIISTSISSYSKRIMLFPLNKVPWALVAFVTLCIVVLEVSSFEVNMLYKHTATDTPTKLRSTPKPTPKPTPIPIKTRKTTFHPATQRPKKSKYISESSSGETSGHHHHSKSRSSREDDDNDRDRDKNEDNGEEYGFDMESFRKLALTMSKDWISSDPNEIRFYLYPKHDRPSKKEEIVINHHGNLDDTDYDDKKGLVILIHGYDANLNSRFPQDIKNAYLDAASVHANNNIVVTSWGNLSTIYRDKEEYKEYFYAVASPNAEMVGDHVVSLLELLIKGKKLQTLEDVHIVGFGIGCQIGGLVAKRVSKLSSTKNHGTIGRLTGIDPANTVYTMVATEDLKKFSKKYIKFADIIHTDQTHLGTKRSIGHVDFYVNGGGPLQPGCKRPDPDKKKNMKANCAHLKGIEYYRLAINSKEYVGCSCRNVEDENCMSRCPDSVIFGENCPKEARGKYQIIIPKGWTFKELEEDRRQDRNDNDDNDK